MDATTTDARADGIVFTGWPIVGWMSLTVVAIQIAVLAVAGVGEEGVRMAIRASARTSIILFGLAFVASSLYRLAPSAFSRWLIANRRYLGVSFAVSHAVHLAAIVALAAVFGQEFPALTVIVGGFGYVLLAAMTATSFDRTAKWLGPRRWSTLHGFGARYLWAVFFVSYLPEPGQGVQLISSLFFSLVVAMAAVRTVAWWKTRGQATRSERSAARV